VKILGAAVLLFMQANFAVAAIRPIFVPMGPQAIILFQGVSTAGGFDPEPREFYESIATQPMAGPGGGKGKVVSVSDKAFVMSCGEKGNVRENVTCSFSIKVTDRSVVSVADQLAEVTLLGDDAALFYQFFAGNDSTAPYLWASKNKWINIVSTPERFWFKFSQH
jgi:hypothetical protein